jgi:clan AA aspartic protease
LSVSHKKLLHLSNFFPVAFLPFLWYIDGKEIKIMGEVYTEITVTNKRDMIKAKEGLIPEKDIRSVSMSVLVDTGATTLVLNDEICNKLGLDIVATKTANLAGGAKGLCRMTDTVQIQWKDRITNVDAIVFPEGEPLLGVVPLEMMDLIVDPVCHELTGKHGDQAVMRVMYNGCS